MGCGCKKAVAQTPSTTTTTAATTSTTDTSAAVAAGSQVYYEVETMSGPRRRFTSLVSAQRYADASGGKIHTTR